MGSKLSSILVQKSLISVKTLQDAFALQVIRGGELDTILLEKGLVVESALTALMSRVSGCPPLQPELFEDISGDLVGNIDLETAQRLGICPVHADEQSIILLISDSTDDLSLEELAFELNHRILPYVAPEIRILQARLLVYGTPLSDRYTKLLEHLGNVPPQPDEALLAEEELPPVEVSVPIIIEPRPPRSRDTLPYSTLADELVPPAEEEPPFSEEGPPTIEDETPPIMERAAAEEEPPFSEEGPPTIEDETPPAEEEPPPAEEEPPPAEEEPQYAEEELSPAEEEPQYAEEDEPPPIELVPRVEPHLPEEVPADEMEAEACTSLPQAEALEAIHRSRSRDDLLMALARGILHHVSNVQVYVLKGGELAGHLQITDGWLDQTRFAGRTLSLEKPSVVSLAVTNGSLYLGPAPDTDATTTLLHAMGIHEPMDLALVPVVLKQKTICLVIGYSTDQPLSPHIRAPLALLGQEAAVALAQLILRRKRTTGTLTPVTTSSPPDPSKTVISDIQFRQEEEDAEKRAIVQEIEILLQQLEQEGEPARTAEETLRAMGIPAIQALMSLFPGELTFDRHAPHGLIPAVSQCSTVLKALTAIGQPVLSSITPLLLSPDVDIRFYATYLLSELIFPEAVSLLGNQLQDDDPEVRWIAGQALRRFKETEHFSAIVEALKADLENPDTRPRLGAAEALGALGDASSFEVLLTLIEDQEESICQAAHTALVSLTKQDFGRDSRGWYIWWESNKQRHRVEWLIDGMIHEAPDIRAASAAELENLTGQNFGYSFDMPEMERLAIRMQFLEWWQQHNTTE